MKLKIIFHDDVWYATNGNGGILGSGNTPALAYSCAMSSLKIVQKGVDKPTIRRRLISFLLP